MLLPLESALRFVEGYKAVLLRVLVDEKLPNSPSTNQNLATALRHVKTNPASIDRSIAALKSDGLPIEPAVERAIRSLRFDHWIYLRHTKSYAIFVDVARENAYHVRALTTPLNRIAGPPPLIFETGLFEYEGFFVCDGLIQHPVFIGPGYRSEISAAYTALRKAGNVHAKTSA